VAGTNRMFHFEPFRVRQLRQSRTR
jgi:hypothetical protein